jgi:hypothetical protein
MDIYNELLKIYPDLTDKDFNPLTGSIGLRDDGDGIQYIAKWDYSKPIPEGLSLGKP